MQNIVTITCPIVKNPAFWPDYALGFFMNFKSEQDWWNWSDAYMRKFK